VSWPKRRRDCQNSGPSLFFSYLFLGALHRLWQEWKAVHPPEIEQTKELLNHDELVRLPYLDEVKAK
jgi:hypothetical protein